MIPPFLSCAFVEDPGKHKIRSCWRSDAQFSNALVIKYGYDAGQCVALRFTSSQWAQGRILAKPIVSGEGLFHALDTLEWYGCFGTLMFADQCPVSEWLSDHGAGLRWSKFNRSLGLVELGGVAIFAQVLGAEEPI